MDRVWVLLQTDLGQTARVHDELMKVDRVILAEGVAGPYDMIVQLEAGDGTEEAIRSMQAIPGINRTLTCYPHKP